jgi:hypothetical protein
MSVVERRTGRQGPPARGRDAFGTLTYRAIIHPDANSSAIGTKPRIGWAPDIGEWSPTIDLNPAKIKIKMKP